MKTLEQINQEINTLIQQKAELEKQTLEQTLYGLFEEMDKEEILTTIKNMMEASPMLKTEVKRLLVDTNIFK